MVPDPDVCPSLTIAQLHPTDTAHEAGDVVEEAQTLYDHGSTPAKLLPTVGTLLLARNTHQILLLLPATRGTLLMGVVGKNIIVISTSGIGFRVYLGIESL